MSAEHRDGESFASAGSEMEFDDNYGSLSLLNPEPENKKPGCIGALCKAASKKMGKIKKCVGKACTKKRRKGSIQNSDSEDVFGKRSSFYGTMYNEGGKRRRRRRTRKRRKRRKTRRKKGGKRRKRKTNRRRRR